MPYFKLKLKLKFLLLNRAQGLRRGEDVLRVRPRPRRRLALHPLLLVHRRVRQRRAPLGRVLQLHRMRQLAPGGRCERCWPIARGWQPASHQDIG